MHYVCIIPRFKIDSEEEKLYGDVNAFNQYGFSSTGALHILSSKLRVERRKIEDTFSDSFAGRVRSPLGMGVSSPLRPLSPTTEEIEGRTDFKKNFSYIDVYLFSPNETKSITICSLKDSFQEKRIQIHKFLDNYIDQSIVVTYNGSFVFHLIKEIISPFPILLDKWYNLVHNNKFRDINLLKILVETATISNKEFYIQYPQCLSISLTPKDILDKYVILRKHAIEITTQYVNSTFDNVINKYGPLTEYVQVKGSIALADINLNGINIDMNQYNKIKTKTFYKYKKSIHNLKLIMPDLLVKISNEKYEVNQKILETKLQQIATQLKIKIPKKIDKKKSFWMPYKSNEFIHWWLKYRKTNYYLNILKAVNFKSNYPKVHPVYIPLLKNGRTSSRNPSIQLFPRKKGFREIFCASPQHKLIAIDYNYIELCTLASICEYQGYKSVLAENIRRNIDPHAYTGSMIAGIEYHDFLNWKENKPDKFQQFRIIGKTLNFSLAGGQSAYGLQKYAKNAYNLDFSLEDSKNFRNKFIYDIYPELGKLLDSFYINNLAKNLIMAPHIIQQKFGIKKNTNVRLHKNRLLKKIQRWDNKLNENIFYTNSYTLTGRVRKDVDYTVAFNNPRSGLAADLAKQALWNLVYSGFKIVAFIHDEVILEIHEDNIKNDLKIVETIFNNSLSDLSNIIPIRSKYKIMKNWSVS